MASKTASRTPARSGARTTRSKANSRGGSRPARSRQAARPRGHTRQHSRPVAAGLACGRLARATWLVVAKGAGGAARSVGRAHDIDPGHRRDGIALALLGLAVVTAASCWLDAARPVGAWIDTGLRTVIGGAVVLLPVIAGVGAVALMRTEPDPENRPRLILGSAMVGLPVLGLWHLWSGSPQTPEGRLHGAGFVGFVIGGPLADGLTAWIAAPLLCIGVLFGVLLLTGTTLREAPETLRNLFAARDYYDGDDYYYDDEDYDDDGPEGQSPPVGDDDSPDWQSRTPLDNYPLDEPPAEAPPAKPARRKQPKAAKATDTTVVLDRGVEGPYTLPADR